MPIKILSCYQLLYGLDAPRAQPYVRA